MNHHYYTLDDDGTTRPVSAWQWTQEFNTMRRVIEKTTVGEAEVSTVFLGLNHNWRDGPPILFETMIFGLELDEDESDPQWRYTTLAEAKAGHEAAVGLAQGLVSLREGGEG